jgi:hypothetical protein
VNVCELILELSTGRAKLMESVAAFPVMVTEASADVSDSVSVALSAVGDVPASPCTIANVAPPADDFLVFLNII